MENCIRVITLLIFTTILLASEEKDNSVSENHRKGKLKHDPCDSENAVIPEGICYTNSECSNLGGTASGSCSKGFGVCCLFITTGGGGGGSGGGSGGGGGIVTRNNTYFVNPGFPQETTKSGTYEVIVNYAENVCQIRLDLVKFKLDGPDRNGQCMLSFMKIYSYYDIGQICGFNDGQHLYVEVDPRGGNMKLAIDKRSTVSAIWAIKIAYIECNSPYKAPPYCMQYYQQSHGVVRSFNFPRDSTSLPTLTYQLATQKYTICIKPLLGYCSISWKLTNRPPSYDFVLSNSALTAEPGDVEYLKSEGDCATDFVNIPNGYYVKNGKSSIASRFCGGGFPAEVRSQVKPFILAYNTNDNENFQTRNTGFNLEFFQQLCT